MKIEICSNSYQSAKNAEEAGANRIELCSELSLGGITPSYGLAKKVITELTIPVFVLIRPRSGDFTYSEEEFEIVKEDIKMMKELGADGIVSGVLNSDFTIDEERTKELVELSHPLPFTFHRAFDWVSDPHQALSQLIELGVKRVLTSGQQSSSEKGIELLKELQTMGKGQILILPGGGIGKNNAHLFNQQFEEIHFAALSSEKSLTNKQVQFNSLKLFNEQKRFVSDRQIIREIIKQTR